MRIEAIEWDNHNREHALIRATQDEIDQVITNGPRVVLNTRGHTATHLLYGQTDGGRRLVVAILYRPTRYIARPITAWEDR